MGVPIYIRIQQYIKARIDSGEWVTDTRIPSEAELSRQFGCSRLPVSTALRELAKDGVIYRVQGKGSFVAEPKAEFGDADTEFARAIMPTGALSYPGEHKCISVKDVIPDREIGCVLRMKPGQYAICIERIKYIDSKPVFLELVFLSQLLYSSVNKGLLEKESVSKLSEMCDIVLGNRYISGEPVICDERTGKLLDIIPGTAIMRYVVEFQDIEGNPVVCEQIYNRGVHGKTLMKK